MRSVVLNGAPRTVKKKVELSGVNSVKAAGGTFRHGIVPLQDTPSHGVLVLTPFLCFTVKNVGTRLAAVASANVMWPP